MSSSIIIVLAIILFALIILNNIKIVRTGSNSNNANCSQTTFGCCPNGVDSKINFYGTNCPRYNPMPGYNPNPGIQPNPIYNPMPGIQKPIAQNQMGPIGGCSGTRYGCCPNNQTPKFDIQGSNCN
jgi:hypothetical protein